MKDFDTLTKFPKNMGKIIVATGFEKLSIWLQFTTVSSPLGF